MNPSEDQTSNASGDGKRGNDTSANAGLRRLFWSTLILLPPLALFIWAGSWQLGRAEEKQVFIDSFNDASQTPVLTAPVDMATAETMLYRRFQLSGRYLPERQVLLDNIVSEGEVGYQVLTPFQTDDTIVLINRGWAKGSADRLQLPDVTVDSEPRTISGKLAFLPSPGIRIDTPLPDPDTVSWPLRMTWPTTVEIGTLLNSELAGWQLLLDSDEPDGYRRDWQPETMGPETHLGYAFQWFSFAALALIIYTLFNVTGYRKRRSARQESK